MTEVNKDICRKCYCITYNGYNFEGFWRWVEGAEPCSDCEYMLELEMAKQKEVLNDEE